MAKRSSPSTRIQLSDERRAQLLDALKAYFASEFDDELSDFKANGLLDFFIRALGPPVYNQGVRDATGYMAAKLADIDGEIHEHEPSL